MFLKHLRFRITYNREAVKTIMNISMFLMLFSMYLKVMNTAKILICSYTDVS